MTRVCQAVAVTAAVAVLLALVAATTTANAAYAPPARAHAHTRESGVPRLLSASTAPNSPSALTFVPLTIGYGANDTAAWLVASAAAQGLRQAVGQAVHVRPAAVSALLPGPSIARDGAASNATAVVLAVASGSPMVRLDVVAPATDAACGTHAAVSLDNDGVLTRTAAAETLSGIDRVVTAAGAHGGVDVLGATGAVLLPGLYVPSYVLDTRPELATWAGLAQPGVAATVFGGEWLCVAPPEPWLAAIGTTRVLWRLPQCAEGAGQSRSTRVDASLCVPLLASVAWWRSMLLQPRSTLAPHP